MKCRRVEILAAVVVLFLSVSPVMAVIEFKDGLIHDIDYLINDEVWVDYESPGMGTTVNMLDGSITSALNGYEDSIINILGGRARGGCGLITEARLLSLVGRWRGACMPMTEAR